MPAEAISDSLDEERFLAFCPNLSISAKEAGTLVPLNPYPTQLYIIREIFQGLRDGIHFFVILKCRQSGCSTICLALDLAWAFMHDGLIGNLITDSNDNKVFFRHVLRGYVGSLPEGEDWRVPIDKDKAEFLSFSNRSLLAFKNANQRKAGVLTRGMGVSLVHGTECAFWDDQEGLEALLPALAQTNPHRLYVFESTANGFNMFQRMYDTSRRAISQRAIFVGWWLHHEYTIATSDVRFEAYWDGEVNELEAGWVEQVSARWHYQITPNQIAWWRWFLAEQFQGNLDRMYQEYPPLPELAFQFSGRPFIDRKSLHKCMTYVGKGLETASYLRFSWGNSFSQTGLEECEPRSAHLVIYEPPLVDCTYCIGVDPSHGWNEDSDVSAAEVFACYEDRVEQVAEFAVEGLAPYRFAWCLLYLALGYRNPFLTIEIQGGGSSLIQEIERVQADVQTGSSDKIGALFGNISTFYYRRIDSMTGAYSVRHWQTSPRLHERMLNNLKAYVERDILIVRSENLVHEMHKLKRSKDGKLEAESGWTDDRVMAAAMAIENYLDPVLPMYLINSGKTYEQFHGAPQENREINGMRIGEFYLGQVQDWLSHAATRLSEKPNPYTLPFQ